ncbi:MAG: putative sulfate exporter family transporter [Verrucomicrobiota bacterium]
MEGGSEGGIRAVRRVNQWLENISEWLPGVALAGGLAWLGGRLAHWIGCGLMGFDKSPVSAIMIAILLGIALRNTIGLPGSYEKGLRFCLKTLLRLGIVLLGIRLSLVAAGRIGLAVLPVVAICIASALLLAGGLNRLLGLSRRLITLIAVGTSICGATAIVATAPAIGADDDEVSYAVACITLFGLLAMFIYPFFSHWAFAADPKLAGLFLGTAIHETAQVAGAGLMYQQQYGACEALDTATVTKLVRNLFMAAVIPLMAMRFHAGAEGARAGRRKWNELVPLFVLGFVLMALVRTVGDIGESAFGVLDKAAWHEAISMVKQTAKLFLTVAMAAVGLGTRIDRMFKLGWKPFAMGLSVSVAVGAVGFVLTTLVGRFVL